MLLKQIFSTKHRMVIATLVFLVIAASSVFAKGPTPECTRYDTFSLHPLNKAEDIQSFKALAKSLSKFRNHPEVSDLERALALAESLDLKEEIALFSFYILREIYYQEYELKTQLSLAIDLEKNIHHLKPNNTKSEGYNIIGNIYARAGDHLTAIRHFQNSYSTADSTDILLKIYALGNLSFSYLKSQDTLSALKTVHKSSMLTNSLEDPEEIAYNGIHDYTLLSETYLAQGRLDSSEYYLNLCDKNANFFTRGHYRYKEVQSIVLPLYIENYIKTKNNEKATLLIDSIRKIRPTLANLYEAEYLESIGNLEQAFTLTKQPINSDLDLDLKRIQTRKRLASQLRNFEEAYLATNELLKISEDNLVLSKKEIITSAQAQIEATNKERLLEAQRYESELTILKTRQRTWIAAVLILISIGIAMWFNNKYRKSQQRTKKLTKIVTQHEEDLLVANANLAAKVKSMERFNHLLSHDLREPVRSISGFTSLLKRKNKTQENIDTDLLYLDQGVKQLSGLMVGVEKLRQVEEHATVTEDVCLFTTMENIENQVRKKYPSRKFQFFVSGYLGNVQYDNLHLNTILLELTDNAVKFNRNKEAIVIVEFNNDGGSLNITVADNGIGIDDAFKSTVFEVFKRLNRREEFEGSGIGLSLVKLAAEKQGGSVTFSSRTNTQGTQFSILLPKVEFGSTVKRGGSKTRGSDTQYSYA